MATIPFVKVSRSDFSNVLQFSENITAQPVPVRGMIRCQLGLSVFEANVRGVYQFQHHQAILRVRIPYTLADLGLALPYDNIGLDMLDRLVLRQRQLEGSLERDSGWVELDDQLVRPTPLFFRDYGIVHESLSS